MQLVKDTGVYTWPSADSIREENNKLYGLNNIGNNIKPVFVISDKVHYIIKWLHREFNDIERLALGKVINDNWTMTLVDLIYPEQTRSSWEVETTKDWMKWAVEYLTEIWEPLEQWSCVLHSHHHMGCFWSWTDNDARLGLNDWRDYSISIVTAYKWNDIDYKGCINFYKPYNIEIDMSVVADTNLVEEFDRRIESCNWNTEPSFELLERVLWEQYTLVKDNVIDNYNNKVRDKVLQSIDSECRYEIEEELWLTWLIDNAIKDIKDRTKQKTYTYSNSYNNYISNNNYINNNSLFTNRLENNTPTLTPYEDYTYWDLEEEEYIKYLKRRGIEIDRDSENFYDYWEEYENNTLYFN